jgi:hypothetical protein
LTVRPFGNRTHEGQAGCREARRDIEKEDELSDAQTSDRDAAETKDDQDLDRELSELLQELRVMLPGVQVLLAFLLTVPFTQRFVTLSGGERGVYFAAVALTSVAIVLLMTPGVQHRMRFREHDKEALLEVSNRLLIVASVLIGAAISSVVFLLSVSLPGGRMSRDAALILVITVFWYLAPWWRRRSRSGHDVER